MYNVFYVESPLQLISAIAAKNKLKSKSKSILILHVSCGKREANDKQIKALLNERDWCKIHIYKIYPNQFIFTLLSLIRILALYISYKASINRFYFGESRNIDMVILGGILRPKETILLDDGSFTITAQRLYLSKKKLPLKLDGVGTRLKLQLCKTLFNWNLEQIKLPNLYSFFDLQEYMYDGQINYCEVTPRKRADLDKNAVFFFGSKFSESGLLTLDLELIILRNALNNYKNKKVYYIPHRDENRSKLSAVEEMGFMIRELGVPAEVYFDNADIMPGTVVSCYSTVLYSCFKRFDNVNVVAIDILDYIQGNEARVNASNIYPYYKDVGITIESMEYKLL